MKNKRIINFLKCAVAIVLPAILIAGTITGCSSRVKTAKLDPENPTVIEVWHYYNGPQKNTFDQQVKEFNETVGLEKGIIVEAASQGSVTELIKKITDSANKKVNAEELPELFAAYVDTAYEVDQMGLVAELDPYFSKAELAEYVPAYLEEGRFDSKGSLKIFPTAKSTEILMLNQTDWDKFASETGVSTEALSTIEGVTQTAKAYYDWTDAKTSDLEDGKAFFGRDAIANYFIVGCKQLGIDIFSVENGEVQINCDESAMRKLWDNFYVPYINGYFASYGKFRSDDAKTGDLIAMVCSTSGATYFPDRVMVNDTESYPIDCKVMPAPCFEGTPLVAVQQGAGMVVTKSTDEKEYASCVFLKWLTEKERNVEFVAGSGYLPVKTDANDKASILQTLAGLEQTKSIKNLTQSLPVAIETVKTHTLYTSKAFNNGTKARDILETSMLDQAKRDLESIGQLREQGMSKAEAVARFDTDENFSNWLASLQNELNAVIG